MYKIIPSPAPTHNFWTCKCPGPEFSNRNSSCRLNSYTYTGLRSSNLKQTFARVTCCLPTLRWTSSSCGPAASRLIAYKNFATGSKPARLPLDTLVQYQHINYDSTGVMLSCPMKSLKLCMWLWKGVFAVEDVAGGTCE